MIKFDYSTNGKPLTVGELRHLLSRCSDSTQITVSLDELSENSGVEYANIGTVELPDFDERQSVILVLSDNFDTRQF